MADAVIGCRIIVEEPVNVIQPLAFSPITGFSRITGYLFFVNEPLNMAFAKVVNLLCHIVR